MMKGFSEYGFNVTLVDMQECENPFETIENKVILKIRKMCVKNFD
jgi:hypothetical protein